MRELSIALDCAGKRRGKWKSSANGIANREGLVMKKTVAVIAVFAVVTMEVAALGDSLGLQVGIGVQGSLSYFECGVILPPIGDRVSIGLKARGMSSVTWATFIHKDGRSVSFHPVVVGGVVSVGGASPLFDETYRMYGGMDFLLGYSFTPYDSLIYKTGNLIGPNLTFGVWGYGGIEVFTAQKLSYCLDSGGGFKTLFGDKKNLYAIGSSWLGSGFGIRTGLRTYF